MDYEFEKKWSELENSLKKRFDEIPDLHTITLLIGLQECAFDYRNYNKDEKLTLMHIGICTILEPYGFYRFTGRDAEGWPMFERVEELPPMDRPGQQMLLKKAILNYFSKSE
jgi:hypothetical protein